MKSKWIIALLLTCALAICASAQENGHEQNSEGPIANLARQNSAGETSPAVDPPGSAGLQDAGTYPERLENVLGAMSAELGQIALAAREGKISRDQAEYLSLERYYVALTRFQLLRTLYQTPEQSNPPQQMYAQANTASPAPGAGSFIAPVTCSPDIPLQIVDYLHLSAPEIQRLQAQVAEDCKQVQPLVDRLQKSQRMLSMKVDGKAGDKEVQALAAEQSQIMKQIIVANSQLEAKLYSMLTKEQQRRVDGLLRQTLTSEGQQPPSQ